MKKSDSASYTFGVSGYKAFKSVQQIDIKGITLVFGPNSSGKSSLINSIKDYYECMINGGYAKSDSFNNKINFNSEKIELIIDKKYDMNDFMSHKIDMHDESYFKFFEESLTDNSWAATSKLDNRLLKLVEKHHKIIQENDTGYDGPLDYERTYYNPPDLDDDNVAEAYFNQKPYESEYRTGVSEEVSLSIRNQSTIKSFLGYRYKCLQGIKSEHEFIDIREIQEIYDLIRSGDVNITYTNDENLKIRSALIELSIENGLVSYIGGQYFKSMLGSVEKCISCQKTKNTGFTNKQFQMIFETVESLMSNIRVDLRNYCLVGLNEKCDYKKLFSSSKYNKIETTLKQQEYAQNLIQSKISVLPINTNPIEPMEFNEWLKLIANEDLSRRLKELGNICDLEDTEAMFDSLYNKKYDIALIILNSILGIIKKLNILEFERENAYIHVPSTRDLKITHQFDYDQVNYWLGEKKLNTGYSIKPPLKYYCETDISELPLKPSARYISDPSDIGIVDARFPLNRIQLSDVGYGIRTIVPVIVAAASKNSSAITLIEEPEMNLHPKLQSDLAELFIQGFKQLHNTFIIETHSEHLLLSFLKHMREGRITREDLNILYVHPAKGQNGSFVEKLELDDDCDFVMPWPSGFFDVRHKNLF